jgi:tetratricopeptide (TPR) repeat protein
MQEGDGGSHVTFDLKYFDQVLADLQVVLNTYPPHFASSADRERAILDVRSFSKIVEIALTDRPDPPIELLWRAGALSAMGHQLDLAEAPKKAVDYFNKAVRVDPNHPEANYRFGVFLCGANDPWPGINFLLKARALGVDAADYSLGMAYLIVDDRERAETSFRDYLKRHPGDKVAAETLRALERGDEIVRKNYSPNPHEYPNLQPGGG